jgi:hypothetical protein
MAIWYMYYLVNRYIFPSFGALFQGKSGNPVKEHFTARSLGFGFAFN